MIQNNNYIIKKSNIHGNGVFALKFIKKGELIEIAIKILKIDKGWINYEITPYFGKFINHSTINANIELYYHQNNFHAIAIKDIDPDQELASNYDGDTIPFFIRGSKSYYKN